VGVELPQCFAFVETLGGLCVTPLCAVAADLKPRVEDVEVI